MSIFKIIGRIFAAIFRKHKHGITCIGCDRELRGTAYSFVDHVYMCMPCLTSTISSYLSENMDLDGVIVTTYNMLNGKVKSVERRSAKDVYAMFKNIGSTFEEITHNPGYIGKFVNGVNMRKYNEEPGYKQMIDDTLISIRSEQERYKLINGRTQ